MTAPLRDSLRGPFHFLETRGDEIQRVLKGIGHLLPAPYPIFLADETASPFRGFPVLLSPGLAALREALEGYISEEERAQIAVLRRQPFTRTAYSNAWQRYRELLERAVENTILASYGRHYPSIFWLLHSQDIARHLDALPKRMLRTDTEIGRRYGDTMKYRVFEKIRDQLLPCLYETVQRLSVGRDEVEKEHLPQLLRKMFENILIFTEEQISADLVELTSFCNGYLRLDGRELRRALQRLADWHHQEIAKQRDLQAVAEHLLGAPDQDQARRLLYRPGYVTYLASRREYRPDRLLSPQQVEVWEALLPRLKLFEVLHALRQKMLPVRMEGEQPVFRASGLDRTWVGQRLIRLSNATRPLDFLSPAVIDPLVHRYGMIYDISDFSSVVSMLRRSGSESQEEAFRMMFRFQRRINLLAASYRLQLEKYLGDGAFFTSREPLRILICAIHLQRLYRQALAEGLPFDRGMRIGLNFGHYRLIPIQGGPDEPERYEFFGHGVVELSRLTSGKSRQEVEEIQNLLISHGYRPQTVERFFQPLAERNVDFNHKQEEDRPFYCYLNRTGSLINEGIVATGELIAQLSEAITEPRLYRCTQGERPYLVLAAEDLRGGRLYLGLRKLGLAHLKGLDALPVYEVIDGADLDDGELQEVEGESVLEAIERLAGPSPRAPQSPVSPSSDRP